MHLDKFKVWQLFKFADPQCSPTYLRKQDHGICFIKDASDASSLHLLLDTGWIHQ